MVIQEPLRDDDLNGETARLRPAFDYSSDEETVWGKAEPPLMGSCIAGSTALLRQYTVPYLTRVRDRVRRAVGITTANGVFLLVGQKGSEGGRGAYLPGEGYARRH